MDNWIGRAWSVFAKEIRDHSRDRRALLLALIYPLLGPMLVAGGLVMAGKTLQAESHDRPITVHARGLEHAPELAAQLSENNISTVPAPENPEEAVRQGRSRVVLVVPPQAAGSYSYTVELITNLGRVDNLRATARLADAIQQYNTTVAAQRAQDAGLPEGYATPIVMKQINVARDANLAVFFYNMMPPLVIFMIFLGGVHLAVDTTVGERERGSLEPLLLAPVERWTLLLGKSMAAFIFTAITTVVNLGAFLLFMSMAAATSTRLVAPPGVDVFVITFLVALPLMAIAVALQMSVSVITRSMKEAQIYLGLLPLVPALPGMVMVFSPLHPTTATAAVPVFGQMLIINQLIAGQTPTWTHVLLSATTTLIAAGLVFWLAAKWFRREKMFVLG